MLVRRANHFALSVSNIERSLAFYNGLLGLEVVGRNAAVAEIPGFSTVVRLPHLEAEWALLRLGQDNVFLELMCYREPSGRSLPEGHGPADRGWAHIALEVDDVDAAHDELVRRGVRVLSRPVNLGRHTTFFAQGPDGEIVELLEERSPLPSQWSV
jgi:catechol 2,3-dioxygenase-like lactoylglutathione lyase family enzyme